MTKEIKTYKILNKDKRNIETSLFVYIRELESKNKQMEQSIKNNLLAIKSLHDTGLKMTGIYRHDKKPEIYDEKIKGVFEDI